MADVNFSAKGHVDFSWEVSRSMAACQGALLLVDASQGVQAQSLSVFHTARERGLKIIPVLNKVKFFSQSIESVSTCNIADRPSGCSARQSQGTNALDLRH